MKDNLTWQVTSLELSKRLEELNFKRDSLWYWVKDYDECKGWQLFTQGQMCGEPDDYYEFDKNHLEGYEYYSAFTVAELGEMLPVVIDFNKDNHINSKGYTDNERFVIRMGLYGKYCSYRYWLGYENFKKESFMSYIEAKTEADTRAKMLIYLIENKLIKNV